MAWSSTKKAHCTTRAGYLPGSSDGALSHWDNHILAEDRSESSKQRGGAIGVSPARSPGMFACLFTLLLDCCSEIAALVEVDCRFLQHRLTVMQSYEFYVDSTRKLGVAFTIDVVTRL